MRTSTTEVSWTRLVRGLKDKAELCSRHEDEVRVMLASLDTSGGRNVLTGSHALKEGLVFADEVSHVIQVSQVKM